jgi:hypothetical protein
LHFVGVIPEAGFVPYGIIDLGRAFLSIKILDLSRLLIFNPLEMAAWWLMIEVQPFGVHAA